MPALVPLLHRRAPVAQGTERRPSKPWVGGSNPPRRTTILTGFPRFPGGVRLPPGLRCTYRPGQSSTSPRLLLHHRYMRAAGRELWRKGRQRGTRRVRPASLPCARVLVRSVGDYQRGTATCATSSSLCLLRLQRWRPLQASDGHHMPLLGRARPVLSDPFVRLHPDPWPRSGLQLLAQGPSAAGGWSGSQLQPLEHEHRLRFCHLASSGSRQVSHVDHKRVGTDRRLLGEDALNPKGNRCVRSSCRA